MKAICELPVATMMRAWPLTRDSVIDELGGTLRRGGSESSAGVIDLHSGAAVRELLRI